MAISANFNMKELIKRHIASSIETKNKILEDESLINELESVATEVSETLKKGGKVIFAGNGGSAADSQHLAAEFVSKLSKPRDPLAAIAITTDTSALTAIGNDYGFENVFLRQLKALGNTSDYFIGITTSGKSPNILNCLEYCDSNNIKSCMLTGQSIENPHAHKILRVPSENVAHIQESHIMLGHLICAIAENELFPS